MQRTSTIITRDFTWGELLLIVAIVRTFLIPDLEPLQIWINLVLVGFVSWAIGFAQQASMNRVFVSDLAYIWASGLLVIISMVVTAIVVFAYLFWMGQMHDYLALAGLWALVAAFVTQDVATR